MDDGRPSAVKLKEAIALRIDFITKDCDTYLHLKREHPELLTEWQSGGGNFLMAVGLFSALNFLAKVHRYLVRPTDFFTQADRDEAGKLYQELSTLLPKRSPAESAEVSITETNNPLTRRNKLEILCRVKAIQPDQAKNESDSFGKLVKAVRKDGIDLGIPADSPLASQEIWSKFRNPLAHMVWVKNGAIEARGTILRAIDLDLTHVMIAPGPPFREAFGGGWICNADYLSYHVKKIAEWLYRQIEATKPEDVDRTWDWLLRQSTSG